ncbi:hypothetical protein PVAP13_2KG257600 [Panicum virgatum]|uniref:Uncharacterized protein n=1 Tax=Panicum virgatum TaxID=38727 RepID=A0A8T0W191_PANVG|nr:hypothetical protein PVAP13_2KG257600 [Panicum virgatum]
MISLRKCFLAACMLFRSFAGNEYNHWLIEYEKDVKRNHMLVVHTAYVHHLARYSYIE